MAKEVEIEFGSGHIKRPHVTAAEVLRDEAQGHRVIANIVMVGAFFVMSAELWSEVERLRPIVALRKEVKKGMRCKIEEKGGTRYVKIVFS